jgi:hypothetical protein
MASLVKLKPFCEVFGKMAVVVASMSHVGKKPREATIFGFTSVVQIAKWLLHGFNLEGVFLLGVWQGFCRSQWRSTWKSPAKGPLINYFRIVIPSSVDQYIGKNQYVFIMGNAKKIHNFSTIMALMCFV